MNKYINKYRKTKRNKLRYMSTHEPKEYWKFLNSLKQNKQTETPNANDFFEHIKKHFAPEDINKGFEDLTHNFNNTSEESLNRPFTPPEVEKCIKKFKKTPNHRDMITF